MHSRVRTITLVWAALFVTLAAAVFAQRSASPPATSSGSPAGATSRIVASAQALLATLDDTGKAKVQFPFDGPQKTRWSNLPSPMFQREGLRLADLTQPQRAAVMTLLSTALSPDGYRKVTEIMRGDEVLKTNQAARGAGRGGGRGVGPAFGEAEYYLAFLGAPSATAPWILQFGGHHLAINLTLGGAQASMTPSLPAAQPASYTLEGRTIRPLGMRTTRRLRSSTRSMPAQRAQAVLNYRVADLVLPPGQDGRPFNPRVFGHRPCRRRSRPCCWTSYANGLAS